jgi:exodeoxyribonuclease VII small subunit
MAKEKEKPPQELTYEEAFAQLEASVQRLEEGTLPLEEALATFERGQALYARCSGLLEQAELKLRQLVPDEEKGFVEEELDLDDA